jgi:ADP-heptose:LPS heptosyltransferase
LDSPDRILILKPSSLGDIVHTLPALAAIRRSWPNSVIQWMVNPEWAPLLEQHPLLNGLLIFPRNQFRGAAGLARFIPWAFRLRNNPFDLVLDFQGLFRSALLAKFAAKTRIYGLSDAREGATFFYHKTADTTPFTHAVDRYLALARLAGAETPDTPEWPLPEGEPVSGLPQRFLLLHPFSRGAGKSMSPEAVEKLCTTLLPTPVVIAGRSEARIQAPSNTLNLLNQTTLPQLLWLLRKAAAVVSVDSGPMHLAAALNPRLLALHTWSDPQKVGPYPKEAWVLKNGLLFQRGTPHQARPLSPDQLPDFLLSELLPSE